MSFQNTLIQSLKNNSNKIAIENNEKKISYFELFDSACKISSFLLKQNLEKETFIGIFLNDKTAIITSMIGILNSRCVFVPIDSKFPQHRIDLMVEELNLKYVISSSNESSIFKENNSLVNFTYENILRNEDKSNEINFPKFDSNDSIYIYFTSGSTGRPKGIIGKNSSLLQFIEWENSTFEINRESRFSQFISPFFDAFMRDVFAPLLSGGTICIPPNEDDFFSSEKLISWVDEHRISIIHCVPSLFYTFNKESLTNDHFQNLKYVLLSGEKIVPSELRNWFNIFNGRIELVNLYGATETTMIRSYHPIRSKDSEMVRIPIGQPISDTKFIILNRELNPCKTLIPGDIYIASEFNAKGYLNNKNLNEEKFVTIELGGSKIKAFKTGDKGRVLVDGNIDLLGRDDRQVKVQGVRIELDEIENVLNRAEFVNNNVIIKDSDENGNEYLKIFFIKNNGLKKNANVEMDVKKYLGKHLPNYMVPSIVEEIDEFPLLNNGKIDIKKLNSIKKLDPVIEPVNELETQVLIIWKGILGDKPISTDLSFFATGGNSLSLMSLIAMLNKTFDIKISLAEIFQNLSIKKQVLLIKKGANQNHIVIPKVKKEHYSLSSSQKRLYFMYEFDKTSVAYNMPHIVWLKGELEFDRFNTAFNRLIERHESLRTRFKTHNGIVVQKIYDSVDFKILFSESKENEIEQKIKNFIKPFDLSMELLLRVNLIKISPEKHLLLIDMHHIISDGVSEGLLVKDFMALYEGQDLPELETQYKDYAEWQQGDEQKNKLVKQKEFWLNEFDTEPNVLELSTDFKRPLIKTFEGDSVDFILGKEDTARLKTIVEDIGATQYMGLLAIFNIFLSKLSNQEDIVVGCPVAGREQSDLENIIGMFVNTLPLRNYPKGELTFKNFLSELKTRVVACFDNQSYQFEDLLDELQPERDTSRNALFEVMFNFHNYERNKLSIPGLTILPYEDNQKMSKFDLTLHATESEGVVLMNLKYSTSLFRQETIKRFISYFESIVNCICENPDSLIKDISLLSENQNLSKIEEYGKNLDCDVETIQSKLDRCFTKFSGNNVLEYNERVYVYSELERNINKVANLILDYKLPAFTPVGILCDDRQWTISSLIGMLKSRMIFVPLDTNLPMSRLTSMISQVECKYIITDKTIEEQEALTDKDDINWITVDEVKKQNEVIHAIRDYKVDDSVYIYFTSGTTGNPKGIVGTNKGLSQFIDWEIEKFNIDSECKFSQLTNPGFDAFLRDVLVPLCSGGTICIPNENTVSKGEELKKWIDEKGINIIHCVPSLFKTFSKNININYFASLKFILLAGEKIMPIELDSWFKVFQDRIQLVNLYGTTETTLVKGFYFIEPSDVDKEYIPVSPMDGTQFMLLDNHGNICSKMIVGEIYIRTPFRTAGYFNNPEENERSFIQNSFSEDENDILYKTGDLGRENLNGEIEILGRSDSQVKINGIRIELDDIKENILKYPGINQAEVVVKNNDISDQLICAYFLSDNQVNEVELRGFLSSILPTYMFPSFICQLESMPLNNNGKINKKALPEPEITLGKKYIPALTKEEKILVKIWSEVLEVENIGITNNFFTIGGDSLKSIRIMTKIKSEGYDVAVKDLFVNQTIESLAAVLIHRKMDVSLKPQVKISPVENSRVYPLSSAQKRVYAGYKMMGESSSFHMFQDFEISKELSKEFLESIFGTLIKRHESLRTSFVLEDNIPFQLIHDEVDFQMVTLSQKEFESDGFNFQTPFNLEHAPLIRVGMVKMEISNRILIDMHHIISDAISNSILQSEFEKLVNNEELNELELQFKDYAVWQNNEAETDVLRNQENYWLNVFSGDLPVLKLPYDFLISSSKSDTGKSITFQLGKEIAEKLKSLSESNGTSIFNVLLTIQSIVFQKISGQEDMIIGIPVAGRNHPGLENIIGLFLNTIALRVNPLNAIIFKDYLFGIGSKMVDALDNQDYQFDDLIRKLKIKRENNQNPLFNVLMMMTNYIDKNINYNVNTDSYILSEENNGSIINNLFIRGTETKDNIFYNIQYNNELFQRETIVRVFNYFIEVSKIVIDNELVVIDDIKLFHALEEPKTVTIDNDFVF